MRIAPALAVMTILVVGARGASGKPATAALEFVRSIPLPGVEGRLDHLAFDAKRKRLVVTAIEAGALIVVDLEKGAIEKRIDGLPAPAGALVLPGDGTIVFSCGRDGSLRWLDPGSFKETARVELGEDADNLRYETGTGRIFVGYAERLGIVEKGKLVASVPLKGHPEGFQVEAGSPLVYVNDPEGGGIEVVDRQKAAVRAFWPLPRDRANYPMALDEGRARVYVGAREPAQLLVFDTSSAKGDPIARLPISGDVDDLFVDEAAHRIYLSCGEGFLDVVERGEKDTYARVERIPTATLARTCCFDPATATLYLAVPKRSVPVAEIRVFRRPK